ncbi:MAG: S1 RNA-binding domain-containing protein [Ilumatobacteraceae bacterium]
MTTSKSTGTDVVVVDGSNIATEGRSMPSLSQLNDAVMAFKDEYPDAVITVVVDATFGHRIDKKEAVEFDEAVAHNELVAPPAGAIGRGDAFVLSIANKVGARILSNDSFQEFHGTYPWLFDEGRLIGGKPVPYVGWVFVPRLPVKGPISRKSQRAARGGDRSEPKASRRTASREASMPMPVPTAPPPGPHRAATEPAEVPADVPAALPAASLAPIVEKAPPPVAPTTGPSVNDLMPFLDFAEHHPVGSSVNGVVESYSSHGSYVTIGDLRGYVPLRLMADPPPRSAREVMHIGDAVTLVVVSFAPARRSVDLAVPHMAPGAEVVPTPDLEELVDAVGPTRRKRVRKVAAAPAESVVDPVVEPVPAAPRRRGRKAAAAVEPVESVVEPPGVVESSGVVEPPAPEQLAPEQGAPEQRAAERPAASRGRSRRATAATPAVDASPSGDATAPAPSRSRRKAAAPKQAAAPTKVATPKKAAAPRKVAAPTKAPATPRSSAGKEAPAPTKPPAPTKKKAAAPRKKAQVAETAPASAAGEQTPRSSKVAAKAPAKRSRSRAEVTQGPS